MTDKNDRPSPVQVLKAIVEAQCITKPDDTSPLLEVLEASSNDDNDSDGDSRR